MLKGSIQEKYFIPINIYVPNTGAFKYIKQILTDKKGRKNSGETSTLDSINGRIFQTESIRQQRS